jgi:hypothetical protein
MAAGGDLPRTPIGCHAEAGVVINSTYSCHIVRPLPVNVMVW